jgi:hypothetical protein
MNILSKVVLGALLLLAALAVWLLPKTRLAPERRIGERLFMVTYVVGAICGAAGLVVLFVWPGRVREWHLWELAVMPLVLVYAYWIAVMRKARTSEVVDEKQNFDMTNAGGLAWGLSIPAMGAAFVLYEEGLFDPSLWFPYYLFVTLLLYSVATLYFFKRR